ncbi:MAG: HNH endonuclease signature motif containing protein [bacterium]|nr:HNH endonuclease signature motif containing protein [bacterium]
MTALVDALLAELRTLSLAGAGRGVLRGLVAALGRVRAGADAAEARVVAAVEGLDDGGVDSVEVLRRNAGSSQREARRRKRRAEALAEMPNVADALAAGAISVEHAEALARAAGVTSAEAVDRDAELLAQVAGVPADRAGRHIEVWTQRNQDPTDLHEQHLRQRRRRRLNFGDGDDGILMAHAAFDRVLGAQFRSLINGISDRIWRAEGGRDNPDSRSAEQRRLDALAIAVGLEPEPAAAAREAGSTGHPTAGEAASGAADTEAVGAGHPAAGAGTTGRPAGEAATTGRPAAGTGARDGDDPAAGGGRAAGAPTDTGSERAGRARGAKRTTGAARAVLSGAATNGSARGEASGDSCGPATGETSSKDCGPAAVGGSAASGRNGRRGGFPVPNGRRGGMPVPNGRRGGMPVPNGRRGGMPVPNGRRGGMPVPNGRRGGMPVPNGRRGGLPVPPRHRVVIVASADVVSGTDPQGRCEIPGVGPIPQSELERLACNAELFGLLFSGDGEPLWHGRGVRTATDAQWQALLARDGVCVLCAEEPSRCEAHHVVPWAKPAQGLTDIDNLALLCGTCHRRLHNNRRILTRSLDGTWGTAPDPRYSGRANRTVQIPMPPTPSRLGKLAGTQGLRRTVACAVHTGEITRTLDLEGGLGPTGGLNAAGAPPRTIRPETTRTIRPGTAGLIGGSAGARSGRLEARISDLAKSPPSGRDPPTQPPRAGERGGRGRPTS